MKVAFMDRDGTINKDYPDEDWRHIDEPELLDDTLFALQGIREKGYQIIIITNQYLINDGVISMSQYQNFTNKLIRKLNNNGVDILDIFCCPHSESENCDCFKPKTGLVDRALMKYPDIELTKSFVVGDSLSDVELGYTLGILTFGLHIKSELFNSILLNNLSDIIGYL